MKGRVQLNERYYELLFVHILNLLLALPVPMCHLLTYKLWVNKCETKEKGKRLQLALVSGASSHYKPQLHPPGSLWCYIHIQFLMF